MRLARPVERIGTAMRRAALVVLAIVAIAMVLASVVPRSNGTRAAAGAVNVYYAGSLVNLNENLVGPAFQAATGYTYQGRGAGSAAIVAQLKGRLATPDVVELADPEADASLMGAGNGSYLSWYLTFARSTLVIGFNPRSRYAADFRLVRKGKLKFYRALLQKGMRIGRTDPEVDPKGYRALWMANLIQREYHLKNFKRRLFGSVENPSQVFSEETLVARILTGQLDAGVFYLSEVKDLGIPYIDLPASVNLGSGRYARLYATQSFTARTGERVIGAPIRYTITIPSTVRNQAGAVAFVRFVLGQRIRAISASHGLLPTKVSLTGKRDAVPRSLKRYIGR